MEYINSGNLYSYINNEQNYINITNNIRSHNDNINPYLYKDKKSYNIWKYDMNINTKISIISSILKAIKSLYDNNIIHGDIKPSNLAIHRKDNNIYIKIIDYGSCYYNMNKINKINMGKINIQYPIGTNGYIAPEQDKLFLNHKSDIYSIGVTLIELWAGDIWFNQNKKSDRNTVLYSLRRIGIENKSLEKIFRKCINLDHTKRPDIYKLYNDFNKLYKIN